MQTSVFRRSRIISVRVRTHKRQFYIHVGIHINVDFKFVQDYTSQVYTSQFQTRVGRINVNNVNFYPLLPCLAFIHRVRCVHGKLLCYLYVYYMGYVIFYNCVFDKGSKHVQLQSMHVWLIYYGFCYVLTYAHYTIPIHRRHLSQTREPARQIDHLRCGIFTTLLHYSVTMCVSTEVMETYNTFTKSTKPTYLTYIHGWEITS